MSMRRLPLLLCFFVSAACAGADDTPIPEKKDVKKPEEAEKKADVKPVWDLVEAYEERQIEGWKALLHKSLLAKEHDDLRERTLKVLGQQLHDIARVVPAEPLARLRKIPIWIERAHPRHPCMCYHVSRNWLRLHGMNPDKAGCVELANCKNFLAWTLDQPWMVLHELAHGYHDLVLGYDHAEIKVCHERAKNSNSYDSVLHINGQKRKHYAIVNHREYFAELTEAFFGTNDFYPFVRSELKAHDPTGYELMEKLWGVKRVR
jgi:hypothetical protein